jgi:hypothetical protein
MNPAHELRAVTEPAAETPPKQGNQFGQRAAVRPEDQPDADLDDANAVPAG